MHSIEKELTKLLKIKAEADEDRQDFLKRLVKSASSLDDAVFDDLVAPVQDWLNNATRAVKAGGELPDFEEDSKKPPKGRVKEEGSAGDKKAAKRDKPQGMSSVMLIRHYLADNPDASNDDIIQFLEKGGHKVLSTVAIGTVRSDFRGVVRVLREKEMFKRDVTLGKA